MQKPLIGYKLREGFEVTGGEELGAYRITHEIAAKVADLRDKAIVEEIVEAARAAGIAELYLIDKRFVIDAIREKIERDKDAQEVEE